MFMLLFFVFLLVLFFFSPLFHLFISAFFAFFLSPHFIFVQVFIVFSPVFLLVLDFLIPSLLCIFHMVAGIYFDGFLAQGEFAAVLVWGAPDAVG